MSAVADADKLGQAQDAMLGELQQFKDTLADESELAKAIKQFTAGNLSALKTMQGQAADLGSSWLHTGDLDLFTETIGGRPCRQSRLPSSRGQAVFND